VVWLGFRFEFALTHPLLLAAWAGFLAPSLPSLPLAASATSRGCVENGHVSEERMGRLARKLDLQEWPFVSIGSNEIQITVRPLPVPVAPLTCTHDGAAACVLPTFLGLRFCSATSSLLHPFFSMLMLIHWYMI